MNKTVFERFAAEVPASECTIANQLTNQNALINEFEDAKTVNATVELYPITQPLRLKQSIPPEVWDCNNSRAVLNKHWANLIVNYRQLDTADWYTPLILKNDIDAKWPVPLFGKTHNALDPVVELVVATYKYAGAESVNFLMHYVAMIVLQWYLLERSQWMSACPLSKNEPLLDVLPPFVCLFYLRFDVKNKGFRVDFSSGMKQSVLKYDYISLVYSVLLAIAPIVNISLPGCPLTDKLISKWCENKLFVTKLQFFVTSRFVHMRVRDFCNAIQSSMQLQNTPASNAIVSEQLTKHFKFVKYQKMHEIAFKGKDPLHNLPDKFSFRNANTGPRSIHQAAVPTFLAHFHFSPYKAMATFPSGDYTCGMWTAGVAVFKAVRLTKLRQTFVTLLHTETLVDSTLFDKIRKALNQLNLEFQTRHSVSVSRIKAMPCFHSLVRLRYSYTIQNYRMFTNPAQLFGLRRDPEFSPRFISPPQWKTLFTRVCHMPTLRDFTKSYKPEPPLTAASKFEFLAEEFALHVVRSSNYQYALANPWLMWYGLCFAYKSEHQALQEACGFYGLMTWQKARSFFVRWYDDFRAQIDDSLTPLTLFQDEIAKVSNRWSFHRPTGPSEAELQYFTGDALYRWCWKTVHDEEWETCSASQRLFIDKKARSDKKVLKLHRVWEFSILRYFRFATPEPLIPKNPDTSWKRFDLFEKQWPECLDLLNHAIDRIRSDGFRLELQRKTNATVNEQVGFELGELPRATLEATLHLLKQLNIEFGVSTFQNDSHVIHLLETLCRFQPTNLHLNQQLTTTNAAKRFHVQLTYYSLEHMDELIRDFLLPELSVAFTEDQLMDQVLLVFASVSTRNRFKLDQYKQLCVGTLSQTTHISLSSTVSRPAPSLLKKDIARALLAHNKKLQAQLQKAQTLVSR